MFPVDLHPVQQPRAFRSKRGNSRARRNVLLGLLLVISVVAVYYPVHSQPFANYDDPDYVSDNVHVRAGLNWETLRWAMTARDAANWHPVTWLSHALDVQLFGITAAGPHVVNLLLHVINALLLFWVLQRATGAVGPSCIVAALFALHPINVESVAWIAERKNLVSLFFFLVALEVYRHYVNALRRPNSAPRERSLLYLLVASLFALGLMSKPQVITLPFVLLLWDYWPLQRFSFRSASPPARDSRLGGPEQRLGSLVWEKVPLLGLCAVSAALTMNAQAAQGATSSYPAWLRLENAIVSYARYLAKAFWPSHLGLFYPYPLKPYPLLEVLAAFLVLAGISAIVAVEYRRRYLVVGWLWFLGTLVPMIGLVQVGTQAMADRYAYLPFIGLFIMVCYLGADVAAQAEFPPVLTQGIIIAVLAILTLLTDRQLGYWDDHISLWTHTLEVTHDNWVAENNLGTALLKAGRVEEAIPHFRAAVALYPADPNSNLNIGTYEQMHHNLPAAIERYTAAAGYARNPKTKARAYNNLGYAYKESGDLIDARSSFQNAVAADPEYAGAWISLGVVAQRLGDLPSAIDAYGRATQIYPSDYGYLLLAAALEQNGSKLKAAEARETAKRISKNFGAAQRYADELLNH